MKEEIPAGWYHDPNRAGLQRYWDGTGWTDQTRPQPPGDTEHTVPLPLNAQGNASPWWKHRWVPITGAILLILFVIGSLSGGNDPKNANAVRKPTTPTVTVTATPEPSTTAPATATATPTPKAKAKPKKQPVMAASKWVMPNEVGKVLQSAQDHIQGITDEPFFFTDSRDASGLGRLQMLDSDWQVCSQRPAPGTSFDEDTDITFYAVKLWERCP